MSGGARRTVDDYRALLHLSQGEAARVLGVSANAISTMAKRHGLKFRGTPDRVRKLAAQRPAPDKQAKDIRLPTRGPMIASPAWGPDRDGRILASGGAYRALAGLAEEWGLPIKRVEARWHVLRAAR